MQKQPLQDVIVKPRTSRPREGSLRQPERPLGGARDSYTQDRGPATPPPPHRPQEPTRYGGDDSFFPRGEQKHTPWLLIALVLGAVVLVVSFGLSLLFAGATVTVFPREQKTVVQGTFTAQTGSTGTGLAFELMTVERTAVKEVPAEAERMVEERATGKATIFNEYSERPQRLIKNTRFAAPDGKIYRIRESVEVPGGTADTPGEIEVTLVAEEPGEEYNREPTEFSIPGLEGLPQSGKVYARATESFTGGFSGMRRQVSDEDRAAARAELEGKLKEELMAAAFSDSDKPVGQYLYREAVFFEYVPGPDEFVGDSSVRVTLNGRLHGVLFPSEQFDEFLARETISGYDGNPIQLRNPEELQVSVATRQETEGDESSTTTSEVSDTEPWKAQTISVTIRGNAHFVWIFDEAMLARDLAGQAKARMYEPPQTSILSGYPGIDRAQATIRPFWKGSFPKDAKEIKIVTKLDS